MAKTAKNKKTNGKKNSEDRRRSGVKKKNNRIKILLAIYESCHSNIDARNCKNKSHIQTVAQNAFNFLCRTAKASDSITVART